MKTAGSLKPASSSDHMEVDHHKGPAGHLASSVGHIGVEASSGSKGHLVLPPVQVSQNSSTSQASGHSGATASPGMSPSAIAGLMAPTGGSGASSNFPLCTDELPPCPSQQHPLSALQCKRRSRGNAMQIVRRVQGVGVGHLTCDLSDLLPCRTTQVHACSPGYGAAHSRGQGSH